MTAVFFIAPVVYLLAVLLAVALCKAAARGDQADAVRGWRNRETL